MITPNRLETKFTKDALNWMYNMRMIRVIGDHRPTVGDVIDYRKARGGSYKDSVEVLSNTKIV